VQDVSPQPLLSDEIHLWEFPLAISGSAIAGCRDLLSDDELTRAARFRFEKDSSKFIAARSSLRAILSGYTNLPAKDLRFAYTKYGKPSLAPNPSDLHPSDLRFNLSHAGERGILGVVRGREIGVDIEAMRENVECEQLAERFFSEHERQTLRSLPSDQKIRAFFRCWTCKEALLKAEGVGLSRSLDSFDIDMSSSPAQILATRPDPAEAGRWRLFELEAPSGYAAAVVVEGTVEAIRVFQFE
jgi:4'-phosphopantetheinyl transferase